MKAYKRSQRVADQMRRDAAEIIADMLCDRPHLIVTVSAVDVTDDLRYAKVFYTVLGDEDKRDQIQQIFQRSAGYIQSELARRLRMRRMPEVSLHYDASLMEGLRITSLIDELTSDTDKADDQKD